MTTELTHLRSALETRSLYLAGCSLFCKILPCQSLVLSSWKLQLCISLQASLSSLWSIVPSGPVLGHPAKPPQVWETIQLHGRWGQCPASHGSSGKWKGHHLLLRKSIRILHFNQYQEQETVWFVLNSMLLYICIYLYGSTQKDFSEFKLWQRLGPWSVLMVNSLEFIRLGIRNN